MPASRRDWEEPQEASLSSQADDLISRVKSAGEKLNRICNAIDGTILFGQRQVIESAVACFAAGGHMLFEGPPGTGKTTLADALSQLFNLESGRVQGTSDMMPSDILGGMIPGRENKDTLELVKGPIFSNILLVDESNRMPEKTHSALLQGMQEKRVSIFGVTRDLPKPFHVMAAQNPFQDGSVNQLPDAMMDRMMVRIPLLFPDYESEKSIIRRSSRTQPVLSPVLDQGELEEIQSLVENMTMSEELVDKIATIVHRTRPQGGMADDVVKKKVSGYGAGPRTSEALASMTKAFAVMAGRVEPTSSDLNRAIPLVIEHRLKLESFQAEQKRQDMKDVMTSITRGMNLS